MMFVLLYKYIFIYIFTTRHVCIFIYIYIYIFLTTCTSIVHHVCICMFVLPVCIYNIGMVFILILKCLYKCEYNKYN